MQGILQQFWMATTYGAGTYTSGVYGGNNPLVQVGPLSLPNTGAGWAVLICAALIAAGGGWMVFMMMRRHRAK
jgi:hypothetical protein